MQRTTILNAYRMLVRFTLNLLSWLKLKTALRVPLGNWRAAVTAELYVSALAPGAALVEELASSALNPWRRNEVFSHHAFQVSLNHPEQPGDLRFGYGAKLIHHDLWLFGFDQVMNLNPGFLCAR